jgi:hypothetical protein
MPVVRKKKDAEHRITGDDHSSDSDNDVHEAQETCTDGDPIVIAGFFAAEPRPVAARYLGKSAPRDQALRGTTGVPALPSADEP